MQDRFALTRLWDDLERWQVRYALLHGGGEALHEGVKSDLDIVVASGDLRALSDCLRASRLFVPVQDIQHESTCHYFVISYAHQSGIDFIPLDTGTDYRRDWRVFFSGQDLLQDRRRAGGVWVTAPRHEWLYLLAKKACKGSLPEHQKARLQALCGELGGEADALARLLFGEESGTRLSGAVRAGRWSQVEAELGALKRELRRQTLRRDPLNALRYGLPEIERAWSRWSRPTGYYVALLGPDGAGKSTLLQNLRRMLVPAFRRTDSFHLRPRLLGGKADEGPVTAPHAARPYNLVLSVVKALYYWLDHVLGYFLRVRPLLVRSSLVLFDRHYEDLMVDPLRTRYGGPRWLIRLLRRLMPSPDLYLVINVPEARIRDRKQEVEPQELARQLAEYRQLGMALPNAVMLDGTASADEVAREAAEVVLERLHERFIRRSCSERHAVRLLEPLRALLADGGTTGSSGPRAAAPQEREYALLTVAGRRSFLVPCSPVRASASALGLYNALNRKARVGKSLALAALRLGVGQRLLQRVRLPDSPDSPLRRFLGEALGRVDLCLAASLGTPGPHRKPVVQVMDPAGRILAYAKIGWDVPTADLVRREVQTLHALAERNPATFRVPRVLRSGDLVGQFVCVLSALEGDGAPPPRDLDEVYLKALRELSHFGRETRPLRESRFWKALMDRTTRVSRIRTRRLVERSCALLEERLSSSPVVFSFAHGDFACWNALRSKDGLMLFDWEYALDQAPAGYDLFHFILQASVLVRKWGVHDVLRQLDEPVPELNQIECFLKAAGMSIDSKHALFLAYLADRISYCDQIGLHEPSTLRGLEGLIRAVQGRL